MDILQKIARRRLHARIALKKFAQSPVLIRLSVPTVVAVILHLTLIVQFTLLNMKILQNNIQSINTSNHWLNLAVQKHHPQVIALQETWSPNDDIKIPGFKIASKWYRKTKISKDKIGGGTAIFCANEAKIVDLEEYQVDNLKAC